MAPSDQDFLTLDGTAPFPNNIGTQISYYDPGYPQRASSIIESFRCTTNDCINQLIDKVKNEEGLTYHSILWGYTEEMDQSIVEGDTKPTNSPEESSYMIPVVSAGSIFDISGYLYFKKDNDNISDVILIRSDDERNVSGASMFRNFFVRKMLTSNSQRNKVVVERLYVGTGVGTDDENTEKGCKPIFGTTRTEIMEARFTGYGDPIHFGDPSDNEYYFSNGVTFDYYSTGEYSTQLTVIGNNCDGDFEPTPGINTETTFSSNGGLLSTVSSVDKPPCIVVSATFRQGASEGAVVLKDWEFKIPGVVDAFNNAVTIEFEMDVYVQVGFLSGFVTDLDRERVVNHMNDVLYRANTEAYDYVMTEYPSTYRTNEVQTTQLSGDQLTEQIKSDVLSVLRNAYITNLTMLDFRVDGNELDLAEAEYPLTDYEVQPGVTFMDNCVFTRP